MPQRNKALSLPNAVRLGLGSRSIPPSPVLKSKNEVSITRSKSDEANVGKFLLFTFEIQAPFARDQIQMESDPFGSDSLFEGRLHGIGSRSVGVYTGSYPCRFYELLAAL